MSLMSYPTRRQLCLGLTAALLGRASVGQASEAKLLSLVPLGKGPPSAYLAFITRALGAFYAVPVRTVASRPLPKAAYYPPRDRYRAERLLAFLRRDLQPGELRLGVTTVDISTTKGSYADWGILGLGELPGAVAVISSYRCHSRAKNEHHAVERLGKTAVHELGHVFGLPHCTRDKRCLISSAGGTVKTIDHEFDVCRHCRRDLDAMHVSLVADGQPPWRMA